MEPLFFLRDEPDFSLDVLSKDASALRKADTSDLFSTMGRWGLNSTDALTYFCLAALVLTGGCEQNRQLVERWRSTKTRNITATNVTVTTMLTQCVSRSKGTNVDLKTIEKALSASMSQLKKELGFPDKSPCRWAYTLDDALLCELEACCMGCRDYFEQCRTRFGSVICEELLVGIAHELDERFPEQAKGLVDFIKKTKHQNHLAALRLLTEGDVNYVCMANLVGHTLTLEDWKFLRLLEQANTAHRLGLIVRGRYGQPETPLAFNHNDHGELVGKFIAEASTLYIRCRESRSQDLVDQGEFIFDMDYALSIYVVLKRLRDDRERFNRLQEAASTVEVCDLFENLPYSTCNRRDHGE